MFMSTAEIETQNQSKRFAHESIAASEQVTNPAELIKLKAEEFPWLQTDTTLSTALVTMEDVTCPPFRFGSAIGTNAKLVQAAEGMSEGQSRNADNMLWSRIGGFVRDKHSSSVEKMPESSTASPIHVLRNNGGQRVYFIAREAQDGVIEVIRLAACDKNKQGDVMSRLSSASDRKSQRKLSK